MLQQEWESRALSSLLLLTKLQEMRCLLLTQRSQECLKEQILSMAPVILIVLAKKDVVTYIYDGSLVMGNLMNAAKSLGVDSIWIHRAKEEFESDIGRGILARLGITDEYEGIGHCALGYAAAPLNDPAPRKDNYVYYI